MRSHLANAMPLCLSLAGFSACSPPAMDRDAGTDSGVPMPSMITASGVLTGTLSAPKPTVGYDAVGNAGNFLLKNTASGLPFKADIAVDYGGMPSMVTYTSASMGFRCNVTVTSGTAAADTWAARANSLAGSDKGSCSLSFSNVTMG